MNGLAKREKHYLLLLFRLSLRRNPMTRKIHAAHISKNSITPPNPSGSCIAKKTIDILPTKTLVTKIRKKTMAIR